MKLGSRKNFNRGRAPRNRATRKSKKDAKSLSRPEKREVARMIRGAGETKMVMWYNGTQNWTGSGALSQQSFMPQNHEIISNVTDILRLIPLVVQGTGDNQRIGERINPISLVVNGTLKLASNNVVIAQLPTNIRVVIYVLQHTGLKTYQALRTQYDNTLPTPNIIGGNDFTQLLQTGEGTTTPYIGRSFDKFLPHADQYYKLLAKKVVTLRYTGAVATPSTATPISSQTTVATDINNWNANFSFNLTKHLPKILRYQETSVTTGFPNDPTNSSLFMCMGYEQFNGNVAGSSDPALLEQQYVAKMLYKDL